MEEDTTLPRGALIRMMFGKHQRTGQRMTSEIAPVKGQSSLEHISVIVTERDNSADVDETTVACLSSLTRQALHEHEPAGALVLTSEDPAVLEKIEIAIEFLAQRLPELESTEMQELIDMAMPRLISRPTVKAFKQAKWNAEMRTDFLANFPTFTSAEVHAQYGSTASNRFALAANWRREGKIFAVENRGEVLYPAFQFDEAGRPKSVITAILKALQSLTSSWQIAMWFTTPNSWLANRKPVDILDENEAVLLTAAEREARPLEF